MGSPLPERCFTSTVWVEGLEILAPRHAKHHTSKVKAGARPSLLLSPHLSCSSSFFSLRYGTLIF